MHQIKTKNSTEINDQSRGTYSTNSDIRFKTTILKSSLCIKSIIVMHTYFFKGE